MIRKNSLFCKLNRIKISSKSIFDSYMRLFRPETETCPFCGSKGNCHIHAYYDRSIIDFRKGRVTREHLCVLRLFCDSCNHTHAILPDLIVPYSSYGILFILQVLSVYFARLLTVEQICEHYGVSRKQLYKWVSLFRSHKALWLGVLDDASTSDPDFCTHLWGQMHYSAFSQRFIRLASFSFLQSHRNPVPASRRGARCHQSVFLPDYDIWRPHNRSMVKSLPPLYDEENTYKEGSGHE